MDYVVDGMSDIALRLTLAQGRLSVVCLNELDTSFRLTRTDGSETLLTKGQAYEVYRGDIIVFGELTGMGFTVDSKLRFHRAPKKPLASVAATRPTIAAAKTTKHAYPTSRIKRLQNPEEGKAGQTSMHRSKVQAPSWQEDDCEGDKGSQATSGSNQHKSVPF